LAFFNASMVVSEEKLGGRPTDRSADVLRIVSGALFLKRGRVRPTLLVASEMLTCMRTAHRKRTSGVRELTWEVYVSCVSGFPL
jgi:hypothetical protein